MSSPDRFSIRPACPSDASSIRGMICRFRLNPMNLEWENFLVAELDGRVIGIGQVKQHHDGSREIASIAVDESWRRKGVAGTIIRALMEREGGPLFLTCRGELVPFYAKFGFREIPTQLLPPYFRRIQWVFSLLQSLRWTKPSPRILCRVSLP